MTASLPTKDLDLINQIETETFKNNVDNISRTNSYFSFYEKHSEIVWSFLASMVSRNAGWNMCDLEGRWFPKIIQRDLRKRLFLTYERANWLIFQDAYPQLLLYQYSTKINEPMFHLLTYFKVSSFMEKEWNRFWVERDHIRLMIALVINEQNVIQTPVIEHPVYKKRVFRSLLFSFQDHLHFSAVLFPTRTGHLYGASVNEFRSLHKRIDLGKRLASILFHPHLYPYFLEFAKNTAHTGSRYDYEQYFLLGKKRTTPFLRTTYPIVEHHIHEMVDWSLKRKINKNWFSKNIEHRHPIHLTEWYEKKQQQLHLAIACKEYFDM